MIDQEKKLNDVIKKYKNMVYRLAYAQMKNSSDADDIFQEVFLRYIKNARYLKMTSMKKHGL
ncbi:MAG: hypothetical protein NC213_10410 [Acetobacter sp.]|nr:hypothetical protein [Bacteroides sp.]MCM1342147.1 hypothetical protein [Acetobacter sp.]MCM1434375.1 hypothetical protein [Clostridiales bacterium]